MYNMHTCGPEHRSPSHSYSLAQPQSSMPLADDLQVLVKKESFQDLYLELKERHRHLDSRASKPGRNKIEDVKRHVWKVSRFECHFSAGTEGNSLGRNHLPTFFPSESCCSTRLATQPLLPNADLCLAPRLDLLSPPSELIQSSCLCPACIA